MARYPGSLDLSCCLDLMKKPVQKPNEKPHMLVGTWLNGHEYETDVEYVVSAAGKGFAVLALDRFDGEKGEVSEVKWDGNVLSFAVYWNSTGRFVKARLLPISPNRVDYTYTFTEQQMWHRKVSPPADSPARRPARQSPK